MTIENVVASSQNEGTKYTRCWHRMKPSRSWLGRVDMQADAQWQTRLLQEPLSAVQCRDIQQYITQQQR